MHITRTNEQIVGQKAGIFCDRWIGNEVHVLGKRSGEEHSCKTCIRVHY